MKMISIAELQKKVKGPLIGLVSRLDANVFKAHGKRLEAFIKPGKDSVLIKIDIVDDNRRIGLCSCIKPDDFHAEGFSYYELEKTVNMAVLTLIFASKMSDKEVLEKQDVLIVEIFAKA